MIFEIGATAFGLIQGLLVMLNKRSNWLFYILQMIFLIVFSTIYHLYGDITNNIIYLTTNKKDAAQHCTASFLILMTDSILKNHGFLWFVTCSLQTSLPLRKTGKCCLKFGKFMVFCAEKWKDTFLMLVIGWIIGYYKKQGYMQIVWS